MSRAALAVLLLLALALSACGDSASGYKKYSPQAALDVFKAAGLEVSEPRSMETADYGAAPKLASEGLRFFIPSLGEGSGGRVLSFDDADKLARTKRYYDELGEQSAQNFSWTFVRGNLLVQINGQLPEAQARAYEQALSNIK